MKQLFLLLSFIFFGIASIIAKPITPTEAELVAQNFYLSTDKAVDIGTIKLSLIQTISTRVYNESLGKLEDIALYYVFNVNQQDGFVMITADDAATPILGYATEGTFDPSIEAVNFIKWAEAYKEEMRFIIENNILATSEITEAWENLRKGIVNNAGRSPSTVNPLLGAIKWNQSPGWNSLCPGGSVVGCVATAMAQIMKYWAHPAQGTGFHSYNHSSYGTQSVNYGSATYNWSAMPNATSSSESAKLSYHCGVAVDMMYSPSGSGAYSEDAKDAFKDYFGYKSSLQYLSRSSYTTSSWKNLLKTDLNANKPLYYAGTGNGGGHAFVCDGFDASDYFHFNWGWGGSYNGYFHIDALNPSGVGTGGGSGGFNSNHRIIRGIEPNTSGGGGGGGTVPASLSLYSNITITPTSPILHGQSFTVDVDIANSSGISFTGDVAAALLDANNNFVSFVETKSTVVYNTGFYYSPSFSSTNMTITPSPGTYKIVLYQKQTGAANWSVIANGSYSNTKTLVIQTVNSGGVNLYATIVSNTTPIVLGQAFSVSTNFHNTSSSAFSGKFSIDLHDMQGSLVATIEERSLSLGSGNVYTNNIVFSSTGLSGISPGTYQLAAWMQPTGGSWELVGNGTYNNPVQIDVVTPALAADVYENNNSSGAAYNLAANFSGTMATVSTPGANIHNGSDYDYYRLYLPTGYSYFVSADVFDSYNSSSGYTNDVLFSYDTGLGFSETYDNGSGTIILPNGGTIIFKVASYYQGQIGTYKFQAVANRGTVSVDKIQEASTWKLYPNPAKDVLNLEFESVDGLEQLEIYNALGQKMYSANPSQEQVQQISTKDWDSGMYWMLIYKEGVISRKSFVVGH